jgi:hypothetical protein
MIYLPWIAFLLAVLWMIRQGDKAKEEYLQRKTKQKMAEVEARSEELKAATAAQRPEEAERERRAKVVRGQGQSTRERPIEELAKTFGHTGEQGRSEWKM